MKVLILTYDFPYPPNSGGKSRIYNLIKFSKDRGIEFHLVSFVRDSYKTSYDEELRKIGVSSIKVFKRKKVKSLPVLLKTAVGASSIFKNLYMDKTVKQYIQTTVKNEQIDVILFESFYTSFYESDFFTQLGVKQIFGTENIEHMLYFDYAKSKSKALRHVFLRQVQKVRREEEQAYRMADEILAVTPEEQDYIKKQTKNPVTIIPNGIDSHHLAYKPQKKIGSNLLFVGNFSYFPNVEAIEFFYKNVFLNIPDAAMTVVGKHQNKLPYLIADPRVKNIEYVEDIRDVYYNADIFVFPVRYGGGTNFKVLEAASCGIPIIAIPDRVKGLGFEEKKHFLGATSPVEFLTGIRLLREDARLAQTLTKNARALVEKEYDWKKIGERLNKVFLAL